VSVRSARARTVAANISKAQALKEQGNAHFKEGQYPQAIAAYHQIFMYVHGYSQSSGSSSGMPGQTTTPVTPEEMALIKELKLAHFSNLAMCHLKHGPNLQKARTNCTKALEIDPKNVKALFRRGKCHAQLGMLDEAKEDLDRVLELQPENKDAVRELRSLRSQFASQRKREAKKFAGMFDRMQDEDASSAAADAAAAAAATDAEPAAEGTASAAVTSGPAAAATGAAAGAPEAVDVQDDDDMGEPLGTPQAFEPSDVLYKAAKEPGMPEVS